MKEYYYLNYGDNICFGLYEVNYEAKIIESVDYRILKKYVAVYNDSIPLLNQIAKTYFIEDERGYNEAIEHCFLIKYEIAVGEYYPRIYRPLYNEEWFALGKKCEDCPGRVNEKRKYYHENENQINEYITEFSILYKRFLDILSFVYADKSNFNCFSGEIRSLIILLNTEIEAQLKGILFENGLIEDRYSTRNYIKLKSIMKLNDYEIEYLNYPKMETIKPFEQWDDKNPTASLFWMDDYNYIKHDKYANIEKATLKNALYSMSALIIILYAQFRNFLKVENCLLAIVKICHEPEWDNTEKYVYENEWKKVKYFKQMKK